MTLTAEGVPPGVSYSAVARSSRESRQIQYLRVLRARLSTGPLSLLLFHLHDYTCWARYPRVNYQDTFHSCVDAAKSLRGTQKASASSGGSAVRGRI